MKLKFMDYRNHYKSIVFFLFFLFIVIIPTSKMNILREYVNMKPYMVISSLVICVLFFIQELKKSKE